MNPPIVADDTLLNLAPRWGALAPAWQVLALAALLLVPLLLIFWLVRVQFANALKKMPEPRDGDVYSCP